MTAPRTVAINEANHDVPQSQPLKGVTVPKPFKLSTSNRPASASRMARDRFTFGERLSKMATKVPDRFLRRPAGEPPQLVSGPSDPKPTVPRPPNLRTEARAASNKKTPLSREDKDMDYMKKHQFKARPLPGSSRPGAHFNPKFPVLRPSKEKRGKTKRSKEAELQESRANKFKEGTVKKARARPRSSQIRHERAAREFREKVRREEEEARLASKFTARPLPASTLVPKPYPQRTGAVVTRPMEITMHSSLRAEQRNLWNRENKARIVAEQRERLELEAANAAIEKKKIAELRRLSTDHGGMAFKAKPIARAAKPVNEPQLSPASLTSQLK